MSKEINGFSKLSKEEKINWIADNFFTDSPTAKRILKQYWNEEDKLQKLHYEFSENTLSNFYLPFSIAPNFLINDKKYSIPMVIEESSVIAAASKSAKLWSDLGGFKAKVISKIKTGQVHFIFKGEKKKLFDFFKNLKPLLYKECEEISSNMTKRGGGIIDIELIDKTTDIPNYYQLNATFDTVDSMGANFINSSLEQFAKTLIKESNLNSTFSKKEKNIEVIMSILSNYVPECLVRAEVSCSIEELSEDKEFNGNIFAQKFLQAIQIAKTQTVRAVTHNKGIMNGVDSVVIATGNDFRAVEAGVHAYASKNGSYTSLSDVNINNDVFTFSIELPISLGTVGGITNLHPLVKWSLNLLGNPSGKELMRIVAVAGLSQNFGALKSLITSGIQKGHMKMHLINILNTR